MVTKAQVSIALVFGVVGMLYQIETDTSRWETSSQGSIYATPEQLERFLTNPDAVEKWFKLVSIFKAADSRPLGIGKRFQAIHYIPLLGEYVSTLQVVAYSPHRLLTLESSSLLKPSFTMLIEEEGPKTSHLTFKMHYRRSSALFQWTVGPVLCLITSQQLQHSLFMLRMIFPF